MRGFGLFLKCKLAWFDKAIKGLWLIRLLRWWKDCSTLKMEIAASSEALVTTKLQSVKFQKTVWTEKFEITAVGSGRISEMFTITVSGRDGNSGWNKWSERERERERTARRTEDLVDHTVILWEKEEEETVILGHKSRIRICFSRSYSGLG